MLVGRDLETAHLAALLEQARHSRSGSLLVRGAPGVGKSALVDGLVANADNVRVLRTRGVELESPMTYAALHRMLHPVMALCGQLPPPQARALRVAFGEEEGSLVEPFLPAVATLTLLTMAAERTTVLCVVDDVHWVDAASATALCFCARRLGADRVLMVFTARDDTAPPFQANDIPEMVLGGLSSDAAKALLERRVGKRPAAAVTERLIAESAGNPLALLELSTQLTLAQLEGEASLPELLHLTSRLEQAFLDRSRGLSPDVQSVLLLAAVDDTGDPDVVDRAASKLGLAQEAMAEAHASGLLTTRDAGLELRHPLVRSALHQAATGGQRRLAHWALASSLTDVGDTDRAAWHRAASADGHDPDAVAALEVVARRAESRGGHGAALTAFERAASLAGGTHRAALTLAAARNAWTSGQLTRARGLLVAARQLTEDPRLLSEIAAMSGRIEVNIGSADDAHRIFTETARAIHPSDPAGALELAVAAAIMGTYGVDGGVALGPEDIDITTSPGDTAQTRCLKHMFLAMSRAAENDWAGAGAALDMAITAGRDVTDLGIVANLGNAALLVGDDNAQHRFYSRALSRGREAGALMSVIYALPRLCFGHFLRGDWVAVRANAEEALELSTGLGQHASTAAPIAWLTLLAALQDRDDYEARLLNLEGIVATQPLGILAGPVHDLTCWAKAVRAGADGDPLGALLHFSDMRVPAVARMAATERIEAAVRAHEPELAARWTTELTDFAAATHREWALAAASHGRALTTTTRELSGGDDPETLFVDALAHHRRSGRTYDLARTDLAYGEWLRRTQRRRESREHLRRALHTFNELQATPLAKRAASELRASGETTRKRDPSTAVTLTPMELQVAQLVSSGLSNKDVAAQIWVSPRTVGFHLRNIFTKAGITTRGELAHLKFAQHP